jgi:hypothetical protein
MGRSRRLSRRYRSAVQAAPCPECPDDRATSADGGAWSAVRGLPSLGEEPGAAICFRAVPPARVRRDCRPDTTPLPYRAHPCGIHFVKKAWP